VVVVWRSGRALARQQVNLRRARLILRWVTVSGFNCAGHLFRYVTSHPGQLSLLYLRGR